MGCDGGTIPKRDELVKVKKKPEQVSTRFPVDYAHFEILTHLFLSTFRNAER